MENHELPLGYWQIFEKLKAQVQVCSKGFQKQSPVFIEEFAYTYLQCLSILSQIRSHSQWRKHLQPCQKVLIQAHAILYPEERTSLSKAFRYLWVELPAQLWQYRYYHLVSLAIILLTGCIGFLVVLRNFEMASIFVPPFLRSTHEMEAYLFSKSAQSEMLAFGRDFGAEIKALFASQLLINNTRVAIFCFIGGILFGIPTVLILIQTGLMMGTFPALFYGGDLIGLGAWILPHSIPEVMAIVLSGGIGLRLGLTALNPGEEGFSSALKNTLRTTAGTVLICVVLLIWAAVVESFIRQSELSNSTRYWVAALSSTPLLLLFVRAFFAYRRYAATSTI